MPSRRVVMRHKCQPLEKVSEGSRYYHDSDVGKTLVAGSTITGITSFVYGSFTDQNSINLESLHGNDPLFVYIKCTGLGTGCDRGVLKLSNNGTEISLKQGEAFSAKLINTSNQLQLITTTEPAAKVWSGEYLLGYN